MKLEQISPSDTFVRAAFTKERAAADLVANQFELEPTRSVCIEVQLYLRSSVPNFGRQND